MSESPEDVLKRLSEGADPRRQRSLQALHQVCEEQRARGSTDYSPAVLGPLCQAKGGPAERALRNPAGAPYRALIAAHAALHGSPKAAKAAKAANASKAGTDGLLDGIRDPLQRARIDSLRDEVKSLRRKLQLAQQVANASAVVTLTASPGGDAEVPEATFGRRASVDLLPLEREALRDALAEDRLGRVGLKVDSRGRVLSATGKELFPVGFATALRKIADEFGVPSRMAFDLGRGSPTTL